MLVSNTIISLILYFQLCKLICAQNNSTDASVISSFSEFSVAINHTSQYELEDSLTSSHRPFLFFPLPNCTPPAIEQFPKPFIGQELRRKGAVIFHIIIALYMFIGIAIVSDDYFVPACEHMAECLKLSADVAGATFMAAGSSAPELATTIVGVFIAKDDIGLGAVVGSAVFNIMFVIGLCGLFGGMVINLNWWPMTRDSIFYTISILALTYVIVDGAIYWYEAVSFLVLYCLYLLMMHINPTLEKWFVNSCQCCCPPPVVKNSSRHHEMKKVTSSRPLASSDVDEDGELFADDTTEFHTLLPTSDGVIGKSQSTEVIMPNGANGTNGAKANNRKHSSEEDGEEEEKEEDKEEEEPWVLHFPSGCWARTRYILCLPLTLAFFLTVPDCRRDSWKKCLVITFIMSCVWISALSYIMVWMIAIIGYTLYIPDTIMGLTFIAAGASVPDAIASLLVARKGEGDMAVSNAVGSNVFDILLCLGLPWTIQCFYSYPHPIAVYSEGLALSSVTLLLTVIFLVVATRLNSWKLDIRFGIILMIVYVIFNILTSLYELNVFGYFHAPECHSEY